MGYLSFFKIDCLVPDKQKMDLLTELENISQYSFYFDKEDNLISIDSIKWYHMEQDMVILSKKYPDFEFSVWRIGEEMFHDFEMAKFKNGKILFKKKCELKPIT